MKCVIPITQDRSLHAHTTKYSEHLLSLQKHREIKGYYPTGVLAH